MFLAGNNNISSSSKNKIEKDFKNFEMCVLKISQIMKKGFMYES